ncbi:MAG: hypothetical protein JWP63_5683 [Candidatus Solibacter sp.]|nr:hypothetical protein [Candidatus Solibacter sp.]
MRGDKGMFAYVQCNQSDVWAPPVQFSPGKPRRMTIDYPVRAKRIVMRLEGIVVLDFPAEFYPTARDQITIGKMLAGRFGLRDLSGKIEVAKGGLKVVMRK